RAIANPPMHGKFAPLLSVARDLGELVCEVLESVLDNRHTLESAQRFALGMMLESLWARLSAIDAPTALDWQRSESVKRLLALPGMTAEQVAKLHGLSVCQVIQERESPGSVCTADYIPPV